MGYLDGTEFIALDDEAVNSDADFDGEQPACAATVQTMRSNTKYLGSQGERITHASVSVRADTQDESSVATGIRPHCSFEFASYLSIPWVFSRGFQGVDVSHFARVSSEDGIAFEGVWSRIRFVGLRDGDAEIIPPTNNGSIDNFERVDLSLDLDEPLRRRVVSDLVIEFHGEIDKAIYADSINVKARSSLVLDTGTPTWDYSASLSDPPNAEDPTLMVSVDNEPGATDSDNGAVFFDHMRAVSGDEKMYVLPSVGASLRETYQDIDTFRLTYIQVKSTEIRSRYADEFTVDRERYRAGRIVRSSDDMYVVSGAIETFRRPRCLWIGPAGVPGGGEENENPKHYHERFKRIQGNETSNVYAFRGSLELETEDPTVSMLMNCIPYQRLFNFTFDGTLEDLRNQAARSQWDLTLTVEEFSGGAWASIGSESVSMDAYHYGLHVSVDYPVLFAEWLRWRELVYTFSDVVVSGSTYVGREGQLWGNRLDQNLVQRESLDVSVDYDPSSGNMCRWSLEVARVTGSEEYKDNSKTDEMSLFWMCTGASLWEIPAELS